MRRQVQEKLFAHAELLKEKSRQAYNRGDRALGDSYRSLVVLVYDIAGFKA